MTESDTELVGVEAAKRAARLLMDEPKRPVEYEPQGPAECHAAVSVLAAKFAAAGATLQEIVEGSRGGAEALSTDTFQGLSEIVQNADDTGASKVDFFFSADTLEVRHDGRIVTLRDLRAMTVPWLTTKADDSSATGRFGVGLSTLHAVADTFELHSGDYHAKIGDPFLSSLSDPQSPAERSDATTLRVTFRPGTATEDDFLRWSERWDDQALMFLQHVRRVSFTAGTTTRKLALRRQRAEEITWPFPDGVHARVVIDTVTASRGRRWLLASTEIPSPTGVERNRKKKAATTPLAVAIPLTKSPRGGPGRVYAGLPVADLPAIPALVNAQFDPVTGRQGFLYTEWNQSLVEHLDELWAIAIARAFRSEPAGAWRCIPAEPGEASASSALDGGDANQTTRELLAQLDHRIRVRSALLAGEIELPVGDTFVPLRDLGVECEDLTGLITEAEVAGLSRTDHQLPIECRDASGDWRKVLADWRTLNENLPREVTVEDALAFLQHPDRAVESVIALTAAALRHDLDRELLKLACVLDRDGNGHRPPLRGDPSLLTTEDAALAEPLGMAIPLHPAYLTDGDDARAVLAWLRDVGAIPPTDDIAVLERLAAAGNADHPIEHPYSDTQLRVLRDALEALAQGERERLGRGIGKAIFIDAFTFDREGRQSATHARPAEAYQPKRIDTIKDGFATAAGTTPDIVWAANKYAEVLKSDAGRGAGLGAQRLLRALGCLPFPRVRPHPDNIRKYQDPRRGLPINAANSPATRIGALRNLDANHTLDDLYSPDLTAVLTNIAKEKSARRRRERAAAILQTLGRARRDLGDTMFVQAVLANYTWNPRGETYAFWIWRAGSIPWLDNELGEPVSPSQLRRRTAATRAVFGDDPAGYIHRELAEVRPEMLRALGVAEEPETADLIRRLIALKEAPQNEDTFAECGIVYQALAVRAAGSGHNLGLTDTQLRDQLSQRGGLIRTTTGWAAPGDLLQGTPVFGAYRTYVPPVPGTEALWTALKVRRPNLGDALGVLSQVAKRTNKTGPTAEDEIVVLETLRLALSLASGRGDLGAAVKAKLRALPLWTSRGWTSKRPVYAATDPQLIEGIGDSLAVWLPGANPEQFSPLYDRLRITPLRSRSLQVAQADAAIADDYTTTRFRRAISNLKDDLARNAPTVESALQTTWEALSACEVRIQPLLQATMTLGEGEPLMVALEAHLDIDEGALFLRDTDLLDRLDGAGRALAAWFDTDERTVAHAWLAAIQA